MNAFIVTVNGQPVCTAGIGADGVMSVIVGSGRRGEFSDFHFHVGGLESSTEEHVRWPTPDLSVGDEITIRIIETDEIDVPQQRYKRKRNADPGQTA